MLEFTRISNRVVAYDTAWEAFPFSEWVKIREKIILLNVLINKILNNGVFIEITTERAYCSFGAIQVAQATVVKPSS